MLNIKSTISNTSIFCTVPIQTENLKKYFIDKTVNFQIDYSKSKLHTDKFLIYLSNLGVPVDLSTDKLSLYQRISLLESYMMLPSVISIPTLNIAASSVVMRRKGYDLTETYPNAFLTEIEVDNFIEDQYDMVDKWVVFLDSCLIYAQKCIHEMDVAEYLTADIPIIHNKNYVGQSIVELFSLDFFFHNYYQKPLGDLAYFKHQFEDYMFQGKNLYHYFATQHNFLLPMLRTLGTAYN